MEDSSSMSSVKDSDSGKGNDMGAIRRSVQEDLMDDVMGPNAPSRNMEDGSGMSSGQGYV